MGCLSCAVRSIRFSVKPVFIKFCDRHVTEKKISLSASVFCDLVDYLCASIVLVRANTDLHNVHLPLSWFKVLFPKVERNPNLKPTDVNPTLFSLVKTLRQVVISLHNGIEPQIGEFG